ncbi:MAG: GNAT family N-acetyltransferase [Chloroflexi bacterium]|nr:GNAT family N-acetyltransferase [Chloroflexota bacterium]
MIEPGLPADREPIADVTRSAGVFTEEEVNTVYELFDQYAQDPGCGYNFLTCREAGRVLGFACWGPTPLTEGANDLYWICAHRAALGTGVGAALFRRVEQDCRAAGGRLLVIWTSGGPEYAPAHRFYARMGCTRDGRVRDFYAPGEDLLVFSKHLQ